MNELLSNIYFSLLSGFIAITWQQVSMMVIGCLLLYLGIAKGYEPLLLVPIGFGAVLVNLPLTSLMEENGLLKNFYDWGVFTEVFPCLIFVGIGAMTDFGPLLQRPNILLLGAAGQFGIFFVLAVALALGFSQLESVVVGIIGACDGPTAIYVTSKYVPQLLGPISVAAYSYMSLVPLLQPPIMRLLTTKREREIIMRGTKEIVTKPVRIIFPILATILTCLIAPKGAPLMGMIMLGNLMHESGVVDRLSRVVKNELSNIVTLLLGVSIGATIQAEDFLRVQTLLIFLLGFLAIILDTASGILFGKLICLLTKGAINPLIGAAGISAYPMAARVAQNEGRKYNKRNYLLMYAMGVNTGGQISSIIAVSIMLSMLRVLGIS